MDPYESAEAALAAELAQLDFDLSYRTRRPRPRSAVPASSASPSPSSSSPNHHQHANHTGNSIDWTPFKEWKRKHPSTLYDPSTPPKKATAPKTGRSATPVWERLAQTPDHKRTESVQKRSVPASPLPNPACERLYGLAKRPSAPQNPPPQNPHPNPTPQNPNPNPAVFTRLFADAQQRKSSSSSNRPTAPSPSPSHPSSHQIPSTTPNRAVSPNGTCERLYSAGVRQLRDKKARRDWDELSDADRAALRLQNPSEAAEYRFTPQISMVSRELTPVMPVWERVGAADLLVRRDGVARIAEAVQKEQQRQWTFAPVITRKSEVIAERARKKWEALGLQRRQQEKQEWEEWLQQSSPDGKSKEEEKEHE